MSLWFLGEVVVQPAREMFGSDEAANGGESPDSALRDGGRPRVGCRRAGCRYSWAGSGREGEGRGCGYCDATWGGTALRGSRRGTRAQYHDIVGTAHHAEARRQPEDSQFEGLERRKPWAPVE